MAKKVIFSGIQPSGNLHIGNYIGALRQWVNLQSESAGDEFIFCMVDLHAITVPQDPKVLHEKNLELAALYLACGIDPAKSHLFVQSDNPDHSYLAWVFDCITPMGWLNRMTQFKDKSLKQAENTTVGLFNYPALMAADILLYDTTHVPVGDDQKQHIELTRDIAEKFNRTYGDTFVLPEPMIQKETARVMSLQNTASKMSKSDANQSGVINMLDTTDEIIKKIKRAVTDSDGVISYDPVKKPAVSNLLTIFMSVGGGTYDELTAKYQGVGYGQFKDDLAQAVSEFLSPVQARYRELREEPNKLNTILEAGAEHARGISSKKIATVRKAVGIWR